MAELNRSSNCIFLPDGLRPTPGIAAHDFVAFGDHVFDGQMQLRHRPAHVWHHLTVAIRPGGFPARAHTFNRLP